MRYMMSFCSIVLLFTCVCVGAVDCKIVLVGGLGVSRPAQTIHID